MKRLVFALFLFGCGSSNSTSTDNQPTSLVGTWLLESVQLVAAPGKNCINNALATFGVISATKIYTAFATFTSGDTVRISATPKGDTLAISNQCTDYFDYDAVTLVGTYLAASGQLAIDFTGKQDQSYPWRYRQKTTASYEISGNTLTIIATGKEGEKFTLIFKK